MRQKHVTKQCIIYYVFKACNDATSSFPPHSERVRGGQELALWPDFTQESAEVAPVEDTLESRMGGTPVAMAGVRSNLSKQSLLSN